MLPFWLIMKFILLVWLSLTWVVQSSNISFIRLGTFHFNFFASCSKILYVSSDILIPICFVRLFSMIITPLISL